MTHKQKAEIYTGSALAIALVFLNATRAFSDPSVEQINAVVKACVETTRAQQAEWGAKPWFDAYYNAASGRVPDNVTNNLGLPSRFVFNKCMAERGFPLGSKGDGRKD